MVLRSDAETWRDSLWAVRRSLPAHTKRSTRCNPAFIATHISPVLFTHREIAYRIIYNSTRNVATSLGRSSTYIARQIKLEFQAAGFVEVGPRESRGRWAHERCGRK